MKHLILALSCLFCALPANAGDISTFSVKTEPMTLKYPKADELEDSIVFVTIGAAVFSSNGSLEMLNMATQETCWVTNDMTLSSSDLSKPFLFGAVVADGENSSALPCPNGQDLMVKYPETILSFSVEYRRHKELTQVAIISARQQEAEHSKK